MPLTLFERIVFERELETEQNCSILTPTLLAITAFLSRSPGLLNWGPGGLDSLGHVPQSSILSLTRLIPNCNSSIGGLRAHFAGCWLSLLHLVSTWSGLQTDWLPVFTEVYNSSTPPSSCGRHNCTHSTYPRSRLYSAIPRPDSPVIYIGVFPIWQPGRVVGQYTTERAKRFHVLLFIVRWYLNGLIYRKWLNSSIRHVEGTPASTNISGQSWGGVMVIKGHSKFSPNPL